MNRAHATRDAWQPQTQQDRDAILRELDEVLASPHFCNSKRYPTLLRYIVDHTLAGQFDSLKERTLGVEVFDRPPTYDTNTDTVVRYTAGEVRKRLQLYYAEHSRHSGVRISLPAGSYIAEFMLEHEAHEAPGNDSGIRPPSQENDGYFDRSTEIHEPHAASLVSVAEESLHTSTPPSSLHEPARSARSRLLWIVPFILLAVVAITGGVWWRLHQVSPQTAVDAFWAPVFRDQRTVIVCTGSSVFAPRNYSGVETAGKNIDYTFVSMQIASAIAQISGTMERGGVATQLSSSATTSLPDLREHSVTLLGGYNNQWTLRLVQPLRFYFAPGLDEKIVDRQQPQIQWQRDISQPYSSADDYALLVRFRDPTIDGWAVVLAGVGRNGTEAAAQFATSPHYLQLLRDKMGGDFGNRNIEAVLKVSVIDGKTGAPSLIAVHTW